MAEDRHWEQKLTELRHSQLDSVRASAAKWLATISTFLGVFGLVSIAEGTSKISELSADSADLVMKATGIAAGMALIAIGLAAYAAQGFPLRRRRPTAAALRRWSRNSTRAAVYTLRLSQILAVGAAIVVLGGSLLVFAQSEPKSAPAATKAIVIQGGSARCGELVVSGETLGVATPAGVVELATGVTQITFVNECPPG